MLGSTYSPPAILNRWTPLVAGMYLEICGGSVYITSLYLTTVKDLWFPLQDNADQMMQQLVFASNLGCWVPFAGIFYDSRFGGPRNTVLCGALFTLVGYCGMWLCAANPQYGSFALLWIFWFLWGHGAGYFDCAVVATSASNFPGARGKVMGVVKAFYGLSGSLLTQVYRAFFSGEGQVPAFLLFLGLAQPAFAVLLSPLLRRLPHAGDNDSPGRRFVLGYALVLLLAFLVLSADLLRASIPSLADSNAEARGYSAGVLAAVVVVAAFLPCMSWKGATSAEQALLPAQEGADDAEKPAVSGRACAITPEAATSTRAGEIRDAPTDSVAEASLLHTAMTINFWLVFVAVFAGTGGGLVMLNNLKTIVEAHLGSADGEGAVHAKNTSDVLVSLASVCNCLGRMVAGAGSDALRFRVPRPVFMGAAVVGMGAAHALLLGGSLEVLLYLGVCVGGLSYGAFWSLIPTLTGELFGMKVYASVYSSFAMAVSLGSLLLSTELASSVYDANILSTPPSPPPRSGLSLPPSPPSVAKTCFGDACYRTTHLVVIGVCGVGTACMVVLYFRTRAFYMSTSRR